MSLASFTYPFLLLKSRLLPTNCFLTTYDPAKPFPPSVTGVHHLQFPVSDVDISLEWYKSVFAASHSLALDHYSPDGKRCIATVSINGMGETALELRSIMKLYTLPLLSVSRLNHESASHCRGSNPLTLAVKTRTDLEQWSGWLDSKSVRRSSILKAVSGWLLVFEVSRKYQPRIEITGKIAGDIRLSHIVF